MKTGKNLIIALLVVLAGTAFTSCIESDNKIYGSAIVSIDSFATILNSVKSDDGYTFNVLNSAAMLNSTKSEFPKRAWIYYSLTDSYDPSSESKTYDIEFISYIAVFETSTITSGLFTPGAPVLAVEVFAASERYIDLAFETPLKKEVDYQNYVMSMTKAEGETLYIDLINLQVMESFYESECYPLSMSFSTPSRFVLENTFRGFTVPANDSISVSITARGALGYDDKKATVFKMKIPN